MYGFGVNKLGSIISQTRPTFSLDFASEPALDPRVDFTRASTGTYLDSDGLLKTASLNTPRIEYDADGNLLGLLVEEARTNSRVYSENLTQDGFTSNSGGSVVLSDSQPDPNGGSTGYTLSGITANGDYQGLYTQTAVTSGQTITGSIWLKGTAGQIIQIRQTRHGTGTFEETLKAVTLTGQWQRESVSHTYAYNQTSSRFDIGVISSGFSVSSISFAWCQLEAGSFPTSYIPTSGSTATRSADVASIATSEFGYNDSEGSVVCEFQVFSYNSVDRVLFTLITNGPNRAAALISLSGNLQYYVVNQGVPQVNTLTANTVTINEFSKAAITYALNDFASILDNGSLVPDTLATVPAFNSLSVGSINSHIKSLKYYPRRLTNAQLQALTL